MKLFEILGLNYSELRPENSKIHLAVWNGTDDPLDIYLVGDFEEWQSWQNQKNFERRHIVSLIQMPSTDRWLFAGGFRSNGCDYISEHEIYQYQTDEILDLNELAGRIVIYFKRSGRQSLSVPNIHAALGK